MDDSEHHPEDVTHLMERLDQQKWHRDQQKQSCGPGFGALYSQVCDRIRAQGILDTVMRDFEECSSDQSRISYVWQLPEVQQLQLRPNTSGKCRQEAQSCEELYDMLVTSEINASRSLEVIQRAIQKTPTDDTNALAIRFMKRAWALLLMEHFDEAYTDVNRCLRLATSAGLLWNAHEILGHCHAKMKQYKLSEANFVKALEGLRKSSASNEEKAAVAGRVSTVFRMVKEENKPKNKAKETAKKQEESKKKRKSKKQQKVDGETKNNEEEETTSKLSQKPEVPKVSFGKNSKLDNTSSAVSVVVVEGRGRCVVANKDIKPGAVVMVDRPYAAVVNADQLHQRCALCCARCLTCLPCADCAVVLYCSEECRSSGAPRHRLECAVMTHLYDATLGKMAPLVFRILDTVTWTRLKKSKEKISAEHLKEDQRQTSEHIESIVEGTETQKWSWDGHYSHKDYLTAFFLVSNCSKRSFGDLLKRSVSAVYITHCLLASGYFGSSNPSDEDLKFVAAIALRHLQSCSCNAYEISEMQLSGGGSIADNRLLEVGGAIYPAISLTNHSCFPNVTRYNLGNLCVLRATRMIPKGAEVLDNYGFFFHIMPSVERRDTLRQQYKFECECDACNGAWPPYPHRQGEPVMFKCPAPSCGCPSSFLDGRRTECAACGDKHHYNKLVTEIGGKLENYSKILQLMHEDKFEAALEMLVKHQMFLEPFACYPAKHFTDVQEMMRHCLNCLGNTYRKKKTSAIL